MLPPRILGLLVLLLAVQSLCKPTKSTEDEDYEDDTPLNEEDEEDEDDNEDGDNLAADAPPQILSESISLRVKAGSTVMLPCRVVHTENYAVTWRKGTDYLYFDAQPHIQESNRIVRLPNNSLIIHNASVNDSSDHYECTILRENNNIMIVHRLLVEPEITQQSLVPSQHSHKGTIRVIPSKRIEVKQGHNIKLGCETDMQPPPEIKWFIENKKIDGYDPDIILDGNYVTIQKVNRSHSGLYQCLAEDGSKSPAVEAITVVVQYVPEVEVKRKVVHIGTGVESEMTCFVHAYPEPIITWYKDNKEITQKKGSIITQHGTTKGNKTKHVLRILHTSAGDFGEYKCRAQNSIGQTTRSIILTGVPTQPKISGAELTDDDAGIILKWHLESYSPISEYRLQYRQKGEGKWRFVEPEVKDGKGNQFIVEHPIKELQPGSYEAILMARNAFGWSPPSEPHVFTGDYPPEMARKGSSGNSAIQIRSPGSLITLILVVLSCAFTSL